MDPKKLLVTTKATESIKEEHLLDYINICLKRKWTILACLFVAFCTALIQNYNLPPIYEATSQIIIDSFYIGIFLIISGFTIFSISKLSLFYKGIWNSFGTRYMKKQFKFLYIAGYISMISGLLLIILLTI